MGNPQDNDSQRTDCETFSNTLATKNQAFSLDSSSISNTLQPNVLYQSIDLLVKDLLAAQGHQRCDHGKSEEADNSQRNFAAVPNSIQPRPVLRSLLLKRINLILIRQRETDVI